MSEVLSEVIRTKRSFGLLLVGLLLAAGLMFAPVFTPAANALSIGGPSDCDNNAMISCGAHSTGALINDYDSSAYLQKVYAYFGVSRADIHNLTSTAVAGHITKNGNVYVDNKSDPVATNAVTAGRQDIPGSTRVDYQGAVFFKRPPSVSFQQNSLPAYVSMQNGTFQFAVIASCGNIAVAHAVPVSPPPKPVTPTKPTSPPKPQVKPQTAPTTQTQMQQQQQSQQVNVNNSNVQNNTPTTTASTPASTPNESTPTTSAPATTSSSPQPATQPSSLVNTGPTGVVGVFLGSVALGTLAYRWLLLRRLNGSA